MKENLVAVPLPEINWNQFNKYYKVTVWGRQWLCPCCENINNSRRKCFGCERERTLLREGDGPRGGEIFGWYMRIDDE